MSVTVLRYDLRGYWSWGEFDQVIAEGKAAMAATPHRVDVIVNLADARIRNYLPSGGLLHIPRLMASPLSNVGMTAIIGAGTYLIRIHQLACAMHGRIGDRFVFAATLEEARLILSEPGSRTEIGIM